MKTTKISVIIPVFNAASTLSICLDSLRKQSIKVFEIIIVDNNSSDNSIEFIKQYQRKYKTFPMILLQQKKTKSVASSYNMALAIAKGEYILGMHSDSSLPTKNELKKLFQPLLENKDTVASYSYVLHPLKIWLSYNFWEKCQSCRVVEKEIPALNGKFDCYRKDALLKLHGFDDVNFDKYGDGNDADIYYRLKTVGSVIETRAKVIHLHYLKQDYSLSNWIEKRKNMSITTGRLLKMYYRNIQTDFRLLGFLSRPLLAILPFLPSMQMIGVLLVITFGFLYTSRMFTSPSTIRDPRIILLPFINIFLIYFETYWILYTFTTHTVRKKTSL